jgi:soluble lytic murein transglycosylase-like protein
MTSCAAAIGLAAAAQAADLKLAGQPAERFEQSIATHAELARYRDALADARKADVAPKRTLIERGEIEADQLAAATKELRDRVAEARESTGAAVGGLAPGVSLATLEAIAACESGGDPTAVNAAGYYGKYQFDMGTWASVGGSGNPAAASEAEQDYRASLLYARAGSSPWPCCGV